MRTLLVVRHGMYDPATGGLTADGRAQIARVRDLLLPHCAGHTVTILSSPADRASQSAELLAAPLGIQPVILPELYSDGDTCFDVADIFSTAAHHGTAARTVVLVTHYEIIRDLPHHVGFQLGIPIARRAIERGHGILIDLDAKTFVHVP